MKWLLVTSDGNPGDYFVRAGIERLVKCADPAAVFEPLNKSDPDQWDKPRQFDRAILCGMPIAWSHHEQTMPEIWWWNRLFDGPVTRDRKKFIALGVGDMIGPAGLHNHGLYIEGLMQLINSAFAVTTRNPILSHPALIDSICPSLFVLDGPCEAILQRETLRLCNIMPAGGHEPHFAPDEVELWSRNFPRLAEDWKKNGFHFVAHHRKEAALAKDLGFDHIHFYETPEAYIRLYQSCVEYVGNRMHGAMMALKAGARACAIGYDSRLNMVRQVGGQAMLPSEFMERGAVEKMPATGWDRIAKERVRILDLLKRFMK